MSALARLRRWPTPRWPSLVLVLGLIFAVLACVPHYTVISQSGPPSALAGVTALTVQYDYSHVAISDKHMSEEEWLNTRKKDEHRNTYLETKESANVGVVEGLQKGLPGVQIATGQAPAGTIQATVSYLEWEEGMYAGPVAWPSKIRARVIFTIDGQTVDEIEIATAENASLATPAPQQRLHTCGQRIGLYAAEFVRNTTGG